MWSDRKPNDLISAFARHGYSPCIIADKTTLKKVSVEFQYNCVENYLFLHHSLKILKTKNIIEETHNDEKIFFMKAVSTDNSCEAVYYAHAALKNEKLLNSPLMADFMDKHEKYKDKRFIKELFERFRQ